MDQSTCNIYYTISRGLSRIIKIIMETYKELSVQAHNQEFFGTEKVSWNKDTSVNISSPTEEREAKHEKLSEFFTLSYC